MAQVVSCQCGQKFSAADHLAGKAVGCPVCGKSLQIPATHRSPPQKIAVSCDFCGARYATTTSNIGKSLACTNCGQQIVVSQRQTTGQQNPQTVDPLMANNTVGHLSNPAHYLSRRANVKPPLDVGPDVLRFLDKMEANKTILEKIGGAIIGICMVFCVFEIVPGWGLLGRFIGLDWPPAVYYLIALVSGAVGGFLVGNRYCVPGMIGYAIGSVCALFAASFPLYYVESMHSGILFALAIGGLIPGALIHQGLKRVQDSLLGA